MKRFFSGCLTPARVEFALAILLTLVALAFHFIFLFHAGPLWRDEISTLALATKPTFGAFWKSLTLDPFPAVYFLLLRLWDVLGFGRTDLALRTLGLLVGVGLIGSLWIASYLVDRSPPLWPVVLFSFNPLTLGVGDSLRPYGCGLIWIVLAFGAVSRITLGGFAGVTVLFALIAAVLSVQSNFTNALILFSIVIGAAVVLMRQKAGSRMLLVCGLGLMAASSLIPYVPVMMATRGWSKILASKNDIATVAAVARDAIAAAGRLGEWTWIALILAIFIGLIVALVSRNQWPSINDSVPKRLFFVGTTLVIALAMTVAFLCAARYLVFPRYFLGVMAIAALCVNVFWNTMASRRTIRALGLSLALVLAIASLRPLSERANMRMTNCDQIAAKLQHVDADDLIILTSPLYGITFQRYYHGAASWVTLPQLEDFTLHRWDLLKKAMAGPDPVPDLVSRAEQVLQSGHKVFLVGKLGPAPATQPESLPPAPQSQFAWQMEAYTSQWKSELTYWIEHHALHGTNLPVSEQELVNPLERLGLFELSGLRER